MTFQFNATYYNFAVDTNERIRIIAAASIHEGFKIADDDEDTTDLKEAFHELMLDDSTEVLKSLIPNLDQTI